MTAPKKKSGILEKMRTRLVIATDLAERFRDEARGVAAVEFAFIAPLMLLMYIGTIEISGAISANRKLSRVASTMGDLITQADGCITTDEVADIMKFSDDIMYPYDHNVAIVVTGIQIDSTATNATVVWSRANSHGTAKAANSNYTVPSQIKIADNFLVAANVKMTYMPTYGWLHYDGPTDISIDDQTGIAMEEELFLRPRIGSTITVANTCS